MATRWGETQAQPLTPRMVALAGGGRLVFDRAADVYRVVVYRPRRPTDRDVPASALQADGTLRFAARHAELTEALRDAFTAADLNADPFEVVAYIRATAWGAELP